jgi:LemA protein
MKSTVVIGVVILFVFILFGAGGCSYNGLVKERENVNSAWAQVENVYQRRADLIPNLVNTVRGAANFEKSTLEAVVAARASATQVKFDANNLDEAGLKRFQQAQDGLSSAISRLLMVTENYPDLKANKNFSELQVQLEGSENRIATERKKFNDVVRTYNTKVSSFPTNLFAGMFGFTSKAYFEAAAGAEKAPEVPKDF